MRSLAPSPKSSSFECCDRKPDPAWTVFVRRMRSVSTVTRAPIASRLLLTPASRTASAAGRERRHQRERGEVVPEDPQLRRLASRHQHEVLVAIAIEVEQRERSAVLIEVEPERAGDLVEAAVTVVSQEHVSLSAGDRSVHQQLVDRPPRLVVRAFPEFA